MNWSQHQALCMTGEDDWGRPEWAGHTAQLSGWHCGVGVERWRKVSWAHLCLILSTIGTSTSWFLYMKAESSYPMVWVNMGKMGLTMYQQEHSSVVFRSASIAGPQTPKCTEPSRQAVYVCYWSVSIFSEQNKQLTSHSQPESAWPNCSILSMIF